METQSDRQSMNDLEILVEQSLKYREIIEEYFTLASQQTLTQWQAARIGEILVLAESDSWLDFLIDQVDYILAQELGLIRESVIQYQLQELRKSLDRFWCEQILREIQEQQCSMEVQKYLQAQDLYDGLIDGYVGSRTKKAIKLYKQGFQVNCQRANCSNLQTRSVR